MSHRETFKEDFPWLYLSTSCYNLVLHCYLSLLFRHCGFVKYELNLLPKTNESSRNKYDLIIHCRYFNFDNGFKKQKFNKEVSRLESHLCEMFEFETKQENKMKISFTKVSNPLSRRFGIKSINFNDFENLVANNNPCDVKHNNILIDYMIVNGMLDIVFLKIIADYTNGKSLKKIDEMHTDMCYDGDPHYSSNYIFTSFEKQKHGIFLDSDDDDQDNELLGLSYTGMDIFDNDDIKNEKEKENGSAESVMSQANNHDNSDDSDENENENDNDTNNAREIGRVKPMIYYDFIYKKEMSINEIYYKLYWLSQSGVNYLIDFRRQIIDSSFGYNTGQDNIEYLCNLPNINIKYICLVKPETYQCIITNNNNNYDFSKLAFDTLDMENELQSFDQLNATKYTNYQSILEKNNKAWTDIQRTIEFSKSQIIQKLLKLLFENIEKHFYSKIDIKNKNKSQYNRVPTVGIIEYDIEKPKRKWQFTKKSYINNIEKTENESENENEMTNKNENEKENEKKTETKNPNDDSKTQYIDSKKEEKTKSKTFLEKNDKYRMPRVVGLSGCHVNEQYKHCCHHCQKSKFVQSDILRTTNRVKMRYILYYLTKNNLINGSPIDCTKFDFDISKVERINMSQMKNVYDYIAAIGGINNLYYRGTKFEVNTLNGDQIHSEMKYAFSFDCEMKMTRQLQDDQEISESTKKSILAKRQRMKLRQNRFKKLRKTRNKNKWKRGKPKPIMKKSNFEIRDSSSGSYVSIEHLDSFGDSSYDDNIVIKGPLSDEDDNSDCESLKSSIESINLPKLDIFKHINGKNIDFSNFEKNENRKIGIIIYENELLHGSINDLPTIKDEKYNDSANVNKQEQMAFIEMFPCFVKFGRYGSDIGQAKIVVSKIVKCIEDSLKHKEFVSNKNDFAVKLRTFNYFENNENNNINDIALNAECGAWIHLIYDSLTKAFGQCQTRDDYMKFSPRLIIGKCDENECEKLIGQYNKQWYQNGKFLQFNCQYICIIDKENGEPITESQIQYKIPLFVKN